MGKKCDHSDYKVMEIMDFTFCICNKCGLGDKPFKADEK